MVDLHGAAQAKDPPRAKARERLTILRKAAVLPARKAAPAKVARAAQDVRGGDAGLGGAEAAPVIVAVARRAAEVPPDPRRRPAQTPESRGARALVSALVRFGPTF